MSPLRIRTPLRSAWCPFRFVCLLKVTYHHLTRKWSADAIPSSPVLNIRFHARRASTTLLLALILIFPSTTRALNVDLENGSLKDLAAWISGATGVNVILGPGVDSTMSVYCPNVRPGEEYQVFKSAVESSGFSVIREGNYVTVINKSGLKDQGYQDPVSQPDLVSQVVPVRNVPVDSLYQVVADSARSFAAAGSVQPVPGRNALVIVADPDVLRKLLDLVDVLDRKRPQVLVEAVIFEVREGEGRELGSDVTVTNNRSDRVILDSLFSGLSDVLNLPAGGYLVFDNPHLDVVIRAIESSDNTRLLSTPSVLVTSSESARISVGQNVPFVTGRVNVEGTAQPVQTIERHDVGVSLQVLPFVLEDGLIDLKINQVSSSVNSSAIAADIITNQRSINTRLHVQDGQYIMLGGLIGEEDRDQVKKIPLLGDIPFLGKLFQSRSTEKVRSRLNVLLRVTLV